MRRLILLCGLLLGLAACGADNVYAPDQAIEAARYQHNGPTSITLLTGINNRSGAGAHTALIVNGSQRVIWDPAGTFAHESYPERGDVKYGATPAMVNAFLNYHVRENFDMFRQEFVVSPEVAEMALNIVMTHGSVGKAQCSKSTSAILARLPSFENFPQSWYPKKTMAAFTEYTKVQPIHYVDDGTGNNGITIKR